MAELKTLFANYQSAEDKVQKAKETVLSETVVRSAAVKAIFQQTGSKGPYAWKGKTVMVVCRKGKTEDGEPIPGQETWFLKSIGDQVQSIE